MKFSSKWTDIAGADVANYRLASDLPNSSHLSNDCSVLREFGKILTAEGVWQLPQFPVETFFSVSPHLHPQPSLSRQIEDISRLTERSETKISGGSLQTFSVCFLIRRFQFPSLETRQKQTFPWRSCLLSVTKQNIFFDFDMLIHFAGSKPREGVMLSCHHGTSLSSPHDT